MSKSPFLIIQRFISPLTCEHIVNSLPRSSSNFYNTENTTFDTKPSTMATYQNFGIQYLQLPILELVPRIESYFNIKYKNIEDVKVEWLGPGAQDKLKCDNSDYLARKWVRNKDRDFSGVIFLEDYNDNIPFDKAYEVYGGKLEFPQHGFGFNPQRGTLIVYPSGPHFINFNTEIKFGELHQVRFYIETQQVYLHSPADFPGDYTEWFKGVI